MQRSHIVNLTWSFLTSGNENANNLWPELCQKDHVKHAARKKQLTHAGESNATVSLDDSEYPELGSAAIRNKTSAAEKKHCVQSPTIRVLVPTEFNMDTQKSKFVRRFKRTEKICINLQEALQNTRCMNKGNSKGLPRLRINIYKGNSGVASKGMDRDTNFKFKKVRVSISKDKKPSKLKRIILSSRVQRAQINVEKREAFEHEKMEAICKEVDSINFNALKITADPEIDVDYNRHMCTMTLYGNDYRASDEGNVPETSVYHRPDIIKKINNLRIGGKSVSNQLAASNSRAYFERGNDTIGDDIIEQTLSLEIKEDIKQENSIELDDGNFLKFSHNFREYCTNMLTPGLNDSLEKFLREITRLQKRFHEKNPNRSKYKRRYYSGLKEVRKHIELKKIKFVIIAPDVEKVDLEDGLNDQVEKLLDMCKRQNIVFCFGLRRRKLGYFNHGRGFVACIGVANYSGTEELYKNVLTELVNARNEFKVRSGATAATIDTSKLISEDYLLSENINILLQILSPISMNI